MASSGKITAQELDPNVFGDTNNKLTSIETKVDTANTKLDTLNQKVATTKKGIAVFDTPGTFNWVCPEGVEVVKLTMFAGGGSGGIVLQWSSGENVNYANGGGGGAYVDDKPVKVIPGTHYSLVVGAGGQGLTHNSGAPLMQGNSGGTTSAFGIICNGGIGGQALSGSIPNGQKAQGNSPLCNPGSMAINMQMIGSSNLADLEVVGGNRFGKVGSTINSTGGGAAGFGSGGDARGTMPVPHGAGSGANLRLSTGNPPVSTLKGGDGIIIIEW